MEPNLERLNHCWEYLRQGLMCNADVMLEWHKYGEQAGTGWSTSARTGLLSSPGLKTTR